MANLAVLALDVYLAHAVNRFRDPAEWLPVWFSLVAPLLLGWEFIRSQRVPSGADQRRWLGYAVGGGAILLGIGGALYHLQSQFFAYFTIRSLVYTAPFAAPLAYTGLGFLLLLNRMVRSDTAEWSHWLIVLALGGFIGLFILALADHAQNGFFYPAEWLPVISAALTIGFLLMVLTPGVEASLFTACLGVLGVQVLIGILGLGLHLTASLQGPSASWLENLLHGPPVMAPLLYPNLALLAGFGVIDLRRKMAALS